MIGECVSEIAHKQKSTEQQKSTQRMDDVNYLSKQADGKI